MSELRVISDDGVLSLTWRKDNAEELARAAKMFTKYVGEGWIAFGEVSGEKTLMFTFNPDVERITLAPIVMGG